MLLSTILLKLTLREIITDIPHDFAAMVVYAMLALFVLGIWYGSRSRPESGPKETAERTSADV